MELQSIVRHYGIHHRPRLQDQLDWFRGQPSLEAAVECAAWAVDRRGKRFKHQRRIRRGALPEARVALLAVVPQLRSCTNFDELLTLVEAVLDPIAGANEMYAYDSALRIGAKLGQLPTKVYLHRGTREGARRLGLLSQTRALNLDAFPEPLRGLPPHELEDILCIYKDLFGQDAREECGLTQGCS